MSAEYQPDPVDVTEVRRDLIAESYQHHAAAKGIASTARMADGLSDAEADLIDAHATIASYAYLLAGLLRVTENRHGADEAREMAALFDAVREVGTEVIEDMNDDLDEQAREAEDATAGAPPFKTGDPVRVVNAANPDLNGIAGTIAGRTGPLECEIFVRVAGFMGERMSCRYSELELIAGAVDAR